MPNYIEYFQKYVATRSVTIQYWSITLLFNVQIACVYIISLDLVSVQEKVVDQIKKGRHDLFRKIFHFQICPPTHWFILFIFFRCCRCSLWTFALHASVPCYGKKVKQSIVTNNIIWDLYTGLHPMEFKWHNVILTFAIQKRKKRINLNSSFC